MESSSNQPATPERLQCVVRDTGPDPQYSIVWLHGLGADGHDFAPIVPQLNCGKNRAIRFVFPHAPVRSVTVNGGMAMRAWYDILGLEIARDQDVAGIRDSLERVQHLIDDERARGVEDRNILLAGFSQGGAIALRCGLALERTLGGIIALSCYLLEADALEQWASEAGRKTPVAMGHGSHDPVVPVALGRDASRRLAAAGVPVQWGEWPMQHSVCPEELAALDRWIDARWA
ncbi:MAG: carboxylesterase [Wenzhouxiangellaceae bacterium]|nr:carboxylesterase [Wenzhouxiangellaceae bacterium]